MKTSAASAKPKPSPPLTLPPNATDEDRYLWLLGCVSTAIYSQFEPLDNQSPDYDYSGIDGADRIGRPDSDFAEADDFDWEERRSEHFARRSAMAASHLMKEFDTHRKFKAQC